jgi:PKD domain
VQGYQAGQEPKPYCKEYLGVGKDKPPVITGFGGPTQLNLNEVGTWKVDAYDPEGKYLSYVVDWGDIVRTQNSTTTGAERAFTQSTTFTHVFTQPGSYTIAIIVRDPTGGSATSSTTVVVGGGSVCTAQYQPVCGERRVCTTGGGSCWNDRKTYGNMCALKGEDAVFLYDGECRTDTGTTYVPPTNCSAWYDGCNNCSRSVIGGNAACTLRACLSGSTTAGYCSAYFDNSVGELSVATTGATATVTGPQKLLQKGELTLGAYVGCGYTITWGDGSTTPAGGLGSSCKTGFTHEYTKQGTYTVQASLWHPGPTDAPVTDWKSSAHATPVPAGLCRAQGVYYSEGQTPKDNCIDGGYSSASRYSAAALMSLIAPQPQKQCLADAFYICRSGVWKIEHVMLNN